MSNAALSLSFLSPLAAGSRPRSRNPSTKPSPRDPKPNPNPKSRRRGGPSLPPASRSGGVATTYTRLPPKDDFALDASLLGFSLSSPSNSDVITLDESPVPAADLATRGRRNPRDPMMVREIEDDDDDEEEEEEELFEYGVEEDDEVGFDAALDEEDFVEDGEFEGDVKEKGVPAVMRCFDTAKIYVKAGDGGNGVVAFRREKFVPYGGPSGGDGGRGGDVYIAVDGSMNSLLPFRKAVHFRAGRGGHGLGRKQGGAKGEDVVVMVPPGTVIRESQTGVVFLEMMHAGERALLLPGGRGGRGNASFKSGTNKVPKIAENGEEGAAMCMLLMVRASSRSMSLMQFVWNWNCSAHLWLRNPSLLYIIKWIFQKHMRDGICSRSTYRLVASNLIASVQ